MNRISTFSGILTEEQIQLVHEKSLHILETIGIKAPCRPFLELLRQHGAQVDFDTGVVRFPKAVMEQMVDEICRAAAPADGKIQELRGSISTEVFLVDYQTKSRRLGVLDDIKKGIALLEHLDSFDSSNAVVVPSDVPEIISDVESFYLLYTYSQKPGETYILTPFSARYIIEMAKVLNRPVSYGFQTVSPLQFTKTTLEMAMLFKEQGMAAGCGPFVMSMGSAPVTHAGALLMQNAEQLACLFCSRALGSRNFSYNSAIHPLDLSTLLCSFGSPSLGVSTLLGASMAHFYGLPHGGNVGLTDALMPDFQCGFEKGFNTMLAAFSGGRSIGGQGIVGADQGISLEQLVIDNEWLSAYNASVRGVEITEETLAEELILAGGIGANFVGEEHTAEFMRGDYWSSKLFARDDWDAWEREGKKELQEKAHELDCSTPRAMKRKLWWFRKRRNRNCAPLWNEAGAN